MKHLNLEDKESLKAKNRKDKEKKLCDKYKEKKENERSEK